MLPSAPKDVGRHSEIFTSALASVGFQVENRMRLPKVDHSVVVLVDGLGDLNLKSAGGHARFLNQQKNQPVRCEFPSSTATSITGFATGVRSSEHGLIGYSVFDRDTGSIENLLTGYADFNGGLERKAIPNLSDEFLTKLAVIGPSAYQFSGLTAITMTGASYIPAETIEDRFTAAISRAKSERHGFTYLYVPELDQLAHRFGFDSHQWLAALENLDQILAKSVNEFPSNTGIIVTADHGIVDVSEAGRRMLSDSTQYIAMAKATAGDPRSNFVYFNDGIGFFEFQEMMFEEFPGQINVLSFDQLENAGWLGKFDSKFESIKPDAVLLWKDGLAGYDLRTAKPSHLKMIGQHGGLSDFETKIPVIRMRAY